MLHLALLDIKLSLTACIPEDDSAGGAPFPPTGVLLAVTSSFLKMNRRRDQTQDRIRIPLSNRSLADLLQLDQFALAGP